MTCVDCEVEDVIERCNNHAEQHVPVPRDGVLALHEVGLTEEDKDGFYPNCNGMLKAFAGYEIDSC